MQKNPMEDNALKVRAYSPFLEVMAACIIFAQTYFYLKLGLKDYAPLIIIEAAVYLTLTFVFNYILLSSTVYSVFGKGLKIPPDSPAVELTEEEKNKYARNAVTYVTLIKLGIILFLALAPLFDMNALIIIFYLPALLGGIFFCIYKFTKYSLYARGYINITSREIWQKYIFYYNPKDKRAVIDKPIGVGSTVNLASPQGKLILGVLLAIPLTVIILLIAVFFLTGKI